VKASPEAQLRLLELSEIDAELARIEHRRGGLPEHAELARLEARDGELRDSIAALTARISDLHREQAKSEADVEQVRARIDRDRSRLDGGMVNSPRELENLQSEVQSLRRRQSDLEEIVLDVMERRESTQATLDHAATERNELETGLASVTAARNASLAELDEQSAKATDRRGEVPEGKKPFFDIPVFNDYKGHLSVIYARRYIESGQRFVEARRLSDLDIEALDYFDSLANDPGLRLDMEFRPGDIQLLHNHTILHDRTAYVDWDEPERKRHLLRLWLSPHDARPLPDIYAERYGSITPGDRGGIICKGTRLHVPLTPS